jgi:hypothetical protein
LAIAQLALGGLCKTQKRKMKKTHLISLLAAVLISSCSPETNSGNKKTRDGDFNIKVIDGCEYIEYDYGLFEQRVYSLTHKGNCKYCVAHQNGR